MFRFKTPTKNLYHLTASKISVSNYCKGPLNKLNLLKSMSGSESGRGHESLFMCVCWTLTDCSWITINPWDAFIFPVTFKMSFQIYICYPPPNARTPKKEKSEKRCWKTANIFSHFFQLGEMISHNVVLIYVTLVRQNTEHLGDKIHFCEKWSPKSFPCLLHHQISVLLWSVSQKCDIRSWLIPHIHYQCQEINFS